MKQLSAIDPVRQKGQIASLLDGLDDDPLLGLLRIDVVTGVLVPPSQDPLSVRAFITSVALHLLQLPQDQQREFEVKHTFLDGMYMRELFIPNGSILIGKIHKLDCINLVSKGRISVMTEHGSACLSSGATAVSYAGTQKLGVALEDTVFVNIFRTNETSIDLVEDAIAYVAEPDGHDEDRLDYLAFMQEYGLNESGVRAVVDDMSDHIDFETGQDSVTVALSAIHGSGIFAAKDFSAGDLIIAARIGSQRTPAGRLTNHAKHPNCRFESNAAGDLMLVAHAPVACGQELTLDYRQAARANTTLGLTPIKE